MLKFQQQSTPISNKNKSFNNSSVNDETADISYDYDNSFKAPQNKKQKMNSDEQRGIERFRRVKEEEVIIDHRVQDNSFEAKVSVSPFFKFSLNYTIWKKQKKRTYEEQMEFNFRALSSLIIIARASLNLFECYFKKKWI